MANLRLSKVGGFNFGSFSLTNDNNTFLIEVKRDIAPKRIVYNNEINQIPIFIGKYEKKTIEVKIGIAAKTKEESRKKQREIIQALHEKEAKLSFLDDEGLYYIASVNEAISLEEGNPLDVLTVIFDIFKPFLYKDEKTATLQIGENKVLNQGNKKSYTLIKLKGSGTATINGIYVEVYNEDVYIDSEKEIIYRLDSSGKKLNHMKFVFGDTFTVLNPGDNFIYLAAAGVTAEISYKHTFIG